MSIRKAFFPPSSSKCMKQQNFTHTHTQRKKWWIVKFPLSPAPIFASCRSSNGRKQASKTAEIPSLRLVIHNQKGRLFFPPMWIRRNWWWWTFFSSIFHLPANAPESESVEPESCWTIDAGILMKDVGLFSVLWTTKWLYLFYFSLLLSLIIEKLQTRTLKPSDGAQLRRTFSTTSAS